LLNFKLRTDLTVWLTLTYALCVSVNKTLKQL